MSLLVLSFLTFFIINSRFFKALNDEFAAMTKKKKDLEDNIELCSQKLDRAEKLIYGLGGERDRWSDMAVSLGSRLINITGDVLLASGVVAYLVS